MLLAKISRSNKVTVVSVTSLTKWALQIRLRAVFVLWEQSNCILILWFCRRSINIRNINNDSDSNASIVVIDEVNADDVGQVKDIKTEIPRTRQVWIQISLWHSLILAITKMQKKFHSFMSIWTIPLMQMNKTKKKTDSSLLYLIELCQMNLTMSIHMLNLYSRFYSLRWLTIEVTKLWVLWNVS